MLLIHRSTRTRPTGIRHGIEHVQMDPFDILGKFIDLVD